MRDHTGSETSFAQVTGLPYMGGRQLRRELGGCGSRTTSPGKPPRSQRRENHGMHKQCESAGEDRRIWQVRHEGASGKQAQKSARRSIIEETAGRRDAMSLATTSSLPPPFPHFPLLLSNFLFPLPVIAFHTMALYADRSVPSMSSYAAAYTDPPSVYAMGSYYSVPSSSTLAAPYSADAYIPDPPRAQWHHQPSAHLTSSYAAIPSTVDSMSSYSSLSPPAQPPYAQADYPEPNPRPALAGALSPPSSTRSYSSLIGHQSPAGTPTLQRASWGGGGALYLDGSDARGHAHAHALPAPASPSPQPPVKTEEDAEGSFIFEQPAPSAALGRDVAAAFESMPEVPLRATGASKEMRKMMGAFRLDPFAMHNGIRSAAVAAPPPGIEVGPLREEPRLIEFQVHLDAPLVPPTPPGSPGAMLYSLADEDDEEKWAPASALSGTAYSFEEDAQFEPLMTPAQSLNWSMGFQGDIDSTAPTYPVQPLSGLLPRSYIRVGPVLTPPLTTVYGRVPAKQPQSSHSHLHPSAIYAATERARSHTHAHAVQVPVRCTQEYEYPGAPIAWYRKTLGVVDAYTAGDTVAAPTCTAHVLINILCHVNPARILSTTTRRCEREQFFLIGAGVRSAPSFDLEHGHALSSTVRALALVCARTVGNTAGGGGLLPRLAH
ncbi:hypothetical protein WOLCODRAFT_167961 [Wolfiporia cocos MD-104 SS10]|uniref:Uncharacterized protein n=1 Tax=Wolfiporia cocos (strain MD-104) TaxID=742152 RepID=A0A2H3JCZ2_WOLCO|nr:hypothetical protein WOLCODRAFT_167961 [Wolfiporia cocos MD-104 SS10]